MKIFVTGGTGYIGSAVAQRLKKAGHIVSALVRSAEKAKDLQAAGIKIVQGELGKPAGYAAAAYGSDAVVHTAQDHGSDSVELDKKAVLAARDLLRGRVGATLIYTSGIWVLGATDGEAVADESAELSPAPIVAWRPAHEKLALEAQKDGTRAVVVRPGIVYGGAKGGIPGMFFGSALKGGAPQIPGEGANAWPMVHIDDLAELYVRLVERAPAGSIFFAVDGSQHTMREVAEAAGKAAGKDGSVSVQSLEQARAAMGPFADALAMNQRVSSAKARDELDWRPRHESFVAEAPALFQTWRAAQ
jgi:nucleoside-diphosphate-sugar epimerase